MKQNLLNTQQVIERYSISRSTLHRWQNADGFTFPKPGYINGRPYWKIADLDAFDESHFTSEVA